MEDEVYYLKVKDSFFPHLTEYIKLTFTEYMVRDLLIYTIRVGEKELSATNLGLKDMTPEEWVKAYENDTEDNYEIEVLVGFEEEIFLMTL